MIDFMVDIRVPDNGARDALVKKCRVQQKQKIVALRFDLAAVHVHNVGEKLKGIKGNAERQGDLRDDFRDTEDGFEVGKKEAGVFENHQNGKTCPHRDGEQAFFHSLVALPGKQQCADIADKGHAAQKQQQRRTAEGVEDQGEDQQDHIALPVCFSKRIDSVADHQEEENEKQTRKNHILLRRTPFISAFIAVF